MKRKIWAVIAIVAVIVILVAFVLALKNPEAVENAFSNLFGNELK